MGKDRLSYENLVIGPLTVFGEMVTGGHWIESLKISRQAYPDKGYRDIISMNWKLYRLKSFYRGFFPWGALQSVKGLPLLFVKTEVTSECQQRGFSNKTSNLIGGVFGGMSQAIFITPTQRMKTIALTNGLERPVQTVKKTISTEGVSTLFRGLTPTVAKRGVDWGIRFYAMSYATEYFRQLNKQKVGDETLTSVQTVLAAIYGGLVSTVIAHPIDTVVAICQKNGEDSSRPLTVVKQEYRQFGLTRFYRGWCMRMVHTSYHTAWIAGIGTILYEYCKAV